MRHKAELRRRFAVWWGIVLAVIIGVAVFSTPALAKGKPTVKPAGKRVAVLPPTDGTAKDAVITAKIANALKQHKIQAVSGGPVKAALGKGSVPSTDDGWSNLARRLKVDGVVESTISQTGAKRHVEVSVHTGADGSVTGQESFAAMGPPEKLAAVMASGFWKKLGAAIKVTSPPKKAGAGANALPPSEPTTPAGKKAEAAAPAASEGEDGNAAEEETTAGTGGGENAEAGAPVRKRSEKATRDQATSSSEPRALEVEVGFRALQRVFEYAGASAGKPYVKHFIPAFEGRAAWFPVTYAGLLLSVEFNPALTTGTNPAYPTSTRELIVGAQGRYPLSFGLVGFSATYFQHMFAIGDTSDTNDAPRSSLDWPDIVYQGARFAVSGRFFLGDIVQVGAEAAYRFVTNPGEGGTRVRSSDYFPNGKTSYGLDGLAFVSVGVMSWLEIRAGVDYRQYGFGALAPGPNNASNINATGASDRYLGFSLGAVGVYGGK